MRIVSLLPSATEIVCALGLENHLVGVTHECDGYSMERSLEDLPILQKQLGGHDLPCVRDGRVYWVNGSSYFSRPGPRLVDSLEILAHALHPDVHPLPAGLPAATRITNITGGAPSQRDVLNVAAPVRSKLKVLLAWSSGKDSAWALHVLRQQPEVDVVGLLTTFNEAADRVAMHAVRRELVEAQALAAGLALWPVLLPWPCSNDMYEQRMLAAVAQAGQQGVTHMAFGDLFLQDVRDYRVRLLSGTGIEPLFPLWCSPAETPGLAHQMLRSGLRAVLTCVDPKQIGEQYVGRRFDQTFLEELPHHADPCGEKGEYHTFCYSGPMFSKEIRVQIGATVFRDGFYFADILPDQAERELCPYRD